MALWRYTSVSTSLKKTTSSQCKNISAIIGRSFKIKVFGFLAFCCDISVLCYYRGNGNTASDTTTTAELRPLFGQGNDSFTKIKSIHPSLSASSFSQDSEGQLDPTIHPECCRIKAVYNQIKTKPQYKRKKKWSTGKVDKEKYTFVLGGGWKKFRSANWWTMLWQHLTPETFRPPSTSGLVELVLCCFSDPTLLSHVQIAEFKTGVAFLPVRTIQSSFHGAERSSLHGPFGHCLCLTVSEHMLKSLLLHSCHFFFLFFLQLRSFKQESLIHKNHPYFYWSICMFFVALFPNRYVKNLQRLQCIAWWCRTPITAMFSNVSAWETAHCYLFTVISICPILAIIIIGWIIGAKRFIWFFRLVFALRQMLFANAIRFNPSGFGDGSRKAYIETCCITWEVPFVIPLCARISFSLLATLLDFATATFKSLFPG